MSAPNDASAIGTRTEADRKSSNFDYPYSDQVAWPGIATLPGLPATAIPLGLSPEGLPVGAQIVGPWLEDRTPLKLAELIEREFGGFVPPPMFDD
jgi:amidase